MRNEYFSHGLPQEHIFEHTISLELKYGRSVSTVLERRSSTAGKCAPVAFLVLGAAIDDNTIDSALSGLLLQYFAGLFGGIQLQMTNNQGRKLKAEAPPERS